MVETLENAVAQLAAVVDSLLAADLSAVSSGGITDLLVGLETQKRRLAAVDAAVLAQVRDRGIAAERCRTSPADLLVSLLRVAPGEAKARAQAAAEVGPRRALSGETLEPVLSRVADALTAGEISPAELVKFSV